MENDGRKPRRRSAGKTKRSPESHLQSQPTRQRRAENSSAGGRSHTTPPWQPSWPRRSGPPTSAKIPRSSTLTPEAQGSSETPKEGQSRAVVGHPHQGVGRKHREHHHEDPDHLRRSATEADLPSGETARTSPTRNDGGETIPGRNHAPPEETKRGKALRKAEPPRKVRGRPRKVARNGKATGPSRTSGVPGSGRPSTPSPKRADKPRNAARREKASPKEKARALVRAREESALIARSEQTQPSTTRVEEETRSRRRQTTKSPARSEIAESDAAAPKDTAMGTTTETARTTTMTQANGTNGLKKRRQPTTRS